MRTMRGIGVTIEKSYSNPTSWELFEHRLGLTKGPLYTKLTLMNSSSSNTNQVVSFSSGLIYNCFYTKQMASYYLAICQWNQEISN